MPGCATWRLKRQRLSTGDGRCRGSATCQPQEGEAEGGLVEEQPHARPHLRGAWFGRGDGGCGLGGVREGAARRTPIARVRHVQVWAYRLNPCAPGAEVVI
jgi:hypothetical protein